MASKIAITESLISKIIKEETIAALQERDNLSEGSGRLPGRAAKLAQDLMSGPKADAIIDRIVDVLKRGSVEEVEAARRLEKLQVKAVRKLPKGTLKRSSIKEVLEALGNLKAEPVQIGSKVTFMTLQSAFDVVFRQAMARSIVLSSGEVARLSASSGVMASLFKALGIAAGTTAVAATVGGVGAGVWWLISLSPKEEAVITEVMEIKTDPFMDASNKAIETYGTKPDEESTEKKSAPTPPPAPAPRSKSSKAIPTRRDN